ncbi:MAG: hypothetical protein BMS9Abin22_025 [Gammaproteobacteria bacterium]|nr:MAG: hypothetical protein BMS9Abin22_025 [Gammaproteobacteria bacterium]
MISAKKLTGLALATAAAGMFAIASIPAANAAEAGKIHCMGVNACKGKTECATATNGCKSQNSCKGKGWLSMTKKECKAKGGKIVDPNK